MGWPILFLKDRWKRYNEKNEVNGPIIYLTAQVKFLDDPSLIPHFISQPMPNASPMQADTSFTKYPDKTLASPLHVHTSHPEHHLCQHITTRAFCAHEQSLQQGPPRSSPNEHRVNSSILLPLSVVLRFPITPRGKPEGPPVPRPQPRPSLRPHLLPLSLLLAMFQLCQPARGAWNKPIISSVKMLCFAVSSLLFLLGEKSLGSVYNSYLSGVRSFFKSQLLRDSILNTLSSKAFSLFCFLTQT